MIQNLDDLIATLVRVRDDLARNGVTKVPVKVREGCDNRKEKNLYSVSYAVGDDGVRVLLHPE